MKHLNKQPLNKCFFSVLITILSLNIIQAPVLQAVQVYQPEHGEPILEPWRWRRFPELAGKTVECVYEAKNGVIWFGLEDGTARYDGLNWIFYNSRNGFTDAEITAICSNRKGEVFFGSRNAIYKYFKGKWTRVFPLRGELNFHIYRLLVSSDGSLWAAMVDGALQIKEQTSMVYTAQIREKNIHPLAGFVDVIFELPMIRYNDFFTIFDIFQDKDGYIWFVGWFGSYLDGHGRVLRYDIKTQNPQDPQVWKVYSDIDGLDIGYDSKMIQTRDGKIWIISRRPDKGITQYSNGHWSHFSLQDLGGSDKNIDIVESADGKCWIGCPGMLCVYDNGKWHFNQGSDLPIPTTSYSLFESSHGDLWIIGRNGEAYAVDHMNREWDSYNGLHFECETADGTQWFLASDSRVISARQSDWKAYDIRDGLIDTPVLLIAAQNSIICCAGRHRNHAATAILIRGRWIRQIHRELSWGIDFRSGLAMADGSIWLGAGADPFAEHGYLGGMLVHPDPGLPGAKWKHLTPPKVPESITNIVPFDNQQLWIGGKTLTSYNMKKNRSRDNPTGAGFENILSLTRDQNGSMWIANEEGSLYRYSRNQLTRYTMQDGLASNLVNSLFCADDGTIWIGTDEGISRFDGDGWISHAVPAQIKVTKEGGTIKQSRNGAIWFNLMDDEWYRRSTPGTQKYNFNTICYFGEKFPPETNVTTTVHRMDRPEDALISWQGADYFRSTPNSEIQYAYRLDGGTWSSFSTETSHVFSEIGNGNHMIEIRARDNNYNLDPTPAQFHFFIAVPIWKQLWFILLCIGFVLVLAFFEYRIIRRDIRLRREARYRTVIEDQSELICRFLPDGQLTFVNLAFCRFYNKTREELLQSNYHLLLSKKDRILLLKQLQGLNYDDPVITSERKTGEKNKVPQWQQWIYRGIYDDSRQLIEFQGVGRDISERIQAEQELRDLTDRLRNLSARLHDIRERESSRLSRKIHDELGQVLTALKFDLFWLSQRTAPENQEQLNKIKSMIDVLNSTTVSVQKLAQELRPRLLHDLGFEAAVDWQLNEFQKRTGIEARLKSGNARHKQELDLETATALYRLFQEALTNVARHSKATRVDVQLKYNRDCLNLIIRDNGVGIHENKIRDHHSLGIISMQERAIFMQGELKISSPSGSGTSVTVKIPVKKSEQAREVKAMTG